ncbi:hypothetical protein DV515_00012888 [Chloebia gouldiae]|uniref:Uncharacterized protein n=1 Tax=Chloebia gouldiae TaxID=44316 RepID=A0A3L8S3J9_CHLGU|nr:hypothetical protein DV515_00012888 [Chloebia gouldiae]
MDKEPSCTQQGSMYDGLADGYGYGTSRGSYYTKTQTGNSNWGYPPGRNLLLTCLYGALTSLSAALETNKLQGEKKIQAACPSKPREPCKELCRRLRTCPYPTQPQLYNGTLKRDVESRRYSSYSQMEGWASRAHSKALCSPRAGSDYCFVQNIKSSRSEPDLYCEPPRSTLRKAHGGGRAEHKATLNRQSIYSSCSTQQGTSRTSKKVPARALSCPSSNKPDVVYAQPMMSCKQDGVYGQAQSSSRICGDEIDAGTMTIQKAIQLLCSSDDKYQAMGAYYLQHTCFQDESAKQEQRRQIEGWICCGKDVTKVYLHPGFTEMPTL